MDQVVEYLLENEVMDGDDFKLMVETGEIPSSTEEQNPSDDYDSDDVDDESDDEEYDEDEKTDSMVVNLKKDPFAS